MKRRSQFFSGSVKERIIRITAEVDELRPEAIEDLIHAYAKISKALQMFPVIMDLTDVRSITLQRRDVNRIVSLLDEEGPDIYPPVVAIANFDVLFGMLRMFQILWENPLFLVVRSEEEAMTFIRSAQRTE